MHRPSIVGPIVLLTIGVVALLITGGKLSAPEFWDWLIRWWPILLVLVGLVSLLEWFIDRDQPYRRKSGSFGIVLLIFILVGIAYSQSHWHLSDRGFGYVAPGEWQGLMGEEHDHDFDTSVSIPGNSSVQVQNPRGDVTITGSGDNLLHVHANQVVNTNSDSDANNTFPSLNPKVTVNGSSVLVKVEGRNNGHADLTIELPEGASTDITAGRGDVSVEGLKGSSNVTSGSGDVKLSDIGASVHVHMNKGDFSAHDIAGSVALDGHVSDVTVSESRRVAPPWTASSSKATPTWSRSPRPSISIPVVRNSICRGWQAILRWIPTTCMLARPSVRCALSPIRRTLSAPRSPGMFILRTPTARLT